MRQVTRLAAVTVVAVLALGAVAAAAPLSKKDWLKQGNAVCGTVNAGVNAAANSAFAGLGKNEKPSDAQIEALVQAVVPVFKDGLAQLDALDEPKSVTAGVKKFEAAVSSAIAKLEADPSILTGKADPFAKADKLAKKIGLKTCASSN